METHDSFNQQLKTNHRGILIGIPRFFHDLQITRKIRNSGMFGTGWYLASNPDFVQSRNHSRWQPLAKRSIPLVSKFARLMLHPIWHYVRVGEQEGKTPCIFFDAGKYLAANPDIRESETNAFWHYIRSGAAEGRSGLGRMELNISRLNLIRTECWDRLGIQEISSGQLPEEQPVTGSIAVHLHLFYPEMKELFIRALRNIPRPFDLFLSCCEDEISTEEFRSALPNVGRIKLDRVPNRGRDMAPFLAMLRKEFTQYDIICHLHTKCSPHDPALRGWRDWILQLLLGSPKQVSGILALLQRDGKMIYPASHPKAEPDSVTGWSCNYDEAGRLLSRYTDLDIRQFPIIDFPHGSMFWARSEALQRLLTLPLTLEDFPAEPIPPDGTTAHALERLLLVLASDVPGKAYRIY